MKIKPLHNNVVIKQDDVQKTQRGNIIVADMGQEKPKTGIVVAVGQGAYSLTGEPIPMQSQVGDRVCFPAFGGTKFNVDGEEYVCVKDADIIAVIEN